MYNTLLCMLTLTELFSSTTSESYIKKLANTYADRLAVCHEVAHKAEALGIKPRIAIAIAYEESRFEVDRVSSAGAIGPMQVLPKYLECLTKPCDSVRDGLLILQRWMKHFPKTYLCHYNAGWRCNRASRRYARRIELRALKLYQQLSKVTYDYTD